MIRVTPAIALNDGEIEERFVRASGPGGQNVRKEATAVELRFDIGASRLPGAMKERLVTLAGKRVKADGVLVVVSRLYRSQLRNREAARTRLVALLQRAARVPKKRAPVRPVAIRGKGRSESEKMRRAVKESRSRGPLEQD